MPIPIGLGVAAAAPELLKLYQAFGQNKEANRLASMKRPSYQIPSSIMEYLNQAKFNAMANGLPGQAQLEAKQAGQQANAIGAIQRSQGSPSAMLTGIAAVNQNALQAGQDLAVKGAQYRAGQQGQYYNALRAMGNEQKAQWEWDKKSPYLNAMAAASALRNASMRNLQGGVEGLSNIAQYAIMTPRIAKELTPEQKAAEEYNKNSKQTSDTSSPAPAPQVSTPADAVQKSPAQSNTAYTMPIQNFNIAASTLKEMYGPLLNQYYGYEVDPEYAMQQGMYDRMHRLLTSNLG